MLIILSGCKRDPLIPISEVHVVNDKGPCNENYKLYSNDTIQFVKKDLHNIFWSINYEPLPGYSRGEVESQFNPDNPYEISFFSKIEDKHGIFVYNFCTNTTRFVIGSDFYYYGYTWGPGEWLFFTAYDQNIWKVKSNGDSLSQITTSGQYNSKVKVSPDGKYISFRELQQFKLLNTSDNTITVTSILPTWYYWLSNDEILSISFTEFEIYNIHTQAKVKYSKVLNDNLSPLYLNTKSKTFYYFYSALFNEQEDSYIFATNLVTHKTDTLGRAYDSYFYAIGDYNEQVDKCLVNLVLQNWKNDDYTINMLQSAILTQIGDGDMKNLREIQISRKLN